MSSHSTTASASPNRAWCALLGVAVLAALTACGSKPASAPAPAPPAAPATPTVSQTCPDQSDGPTIVVQAVEDARRAMAANPTGAVPPACLVAAFVRLPVVLPDSLTQHALGIAAELDRRGVDRPGVLASEVTLLARTRQYQEALAAYDRLKAIDPRPPMEVTRVAIVAARQRGDTTTLVKLLTAAVARPDASQPMRTELTILQQVGALKTAITEARGFIRQNPKYLAAYPTLVANFGTLGNVDSVVAYIGRGLRQGVTRNSLMPTLEPLINTKLRHAALYGSAYGWDAQIVAASRVDSALTTPSTKFLVASLIAQAAEPQIAEIGAEISGSSMAPTVTGAAARSEPTQGRAAACARIAGLQSMLDVAGARLRDGGDRYPGGAQSIVAGVAGERERLAALREVCSRA